MSELSHDLIVSFPPTLAAAAALFVALGNRKISAGGRAQIEKQLHQVHIMLDGQLAKMCTLIENSAYLRGLSAGKGEATAAEIVAREAQKGKTDTF